MSTENDATRRSIRATVDEYVAGHDALGLPADTEEFSEIWASIQRIEQCLSETKANAWRERWNTTPSTT